MSGDRHGNRAWMISNSSAGRSAFSTAIASSRVQPLRIRSAANKKAACTIFFLPIIAVSSSPTVPSLRASLPVNQSDGRPEWQGESLRFKPLSSSPSLQTCPPWREPPSQKFGGEVTQPVVTNCIDREVSHHCCNIVRNAASILRAKAPSSHNGDAAMRGRKARRSSSNRPGLPTKARR
jgi:hypothetical protein